MHRIKAAMGFFNEAIRKDTKSSSPTHASNLINSLSPGRESGQESFSSKNSEPENLTKINFYPGDIQNVLTQYYTLKTASCNRPTSSHIKQLEIFSTQLTALTPLTQDEIDSLEIILHSIEVDQAHSLKTFEASKSLRDKMALYLKEKPESISRRGCGLRRS